MWLRNGCIAIMMLLVFASCHNKLHKRHVRTKHKFTTEEYVATYHKVARKQMRKYGIPASITLAQGILESANGNSEVARKANNHFGIKCSRGWDGNTYYAKDDRPNECFRKYKHAAECFEDHSRFLAREKRYSSLFRLSSDDYKGWATGLREAGYATNSKYHKLLISIIEKHKLYEYD